MRSKIRLWQWPNLTALDAASLAVFWQAALAHALQQQLSVPAHAVLGLSVWLTYLADRLLDVAPRAESALLSLRHQFTKRQARPLWLIWGGALLLNLALATQLSREQLLRGACLLAICLVYTLLNQTLSRRFFPKELCVAGIYAGGVAVFLPAGTVPVSFILSFAGLCLFNCLIIGVKEASIDAGLQIHSLAGLISEKWFGLWILLSGGAVLGCKVVGNRPLAMSFALLALLHFSRNKIAIENFRVLADELLFVGPLLLLLC
jgi:hypothetical protein